MTFWNDKRVLVTGGAGFIGSHAAELLVEKGARVTVADNLENGNLKNLERVREQIEFVKCDLKDPGDAARAARGMDIILHLAAKVGGIGYNKEHPGTMFRSNMMMQINVLEAARVNRVSRLVMVSSACVYRRDCTIPTPESEGFEGVPEPTNEGYGWAKRMAELQAKLYETEFGMAIAVVRPYNAYGPRDHFDPEKSHVIPALIRRVFSGEDPLVVWGNGEQSRSFLYVTDFAEGILLAAEKGCGKGPINLGTVEEIKIKDLVRMIADASEKDISIHYDTAKPTGQPRRNCDSSRAGEILGFAPKVRLKEGLRQTIEWYKRKENEK
ncbi:MAG: SDR family NAD(P)-dependent oxidoreductase [archaeon]